MIIDYNSYIPFECTKQEALKHLEERTFGITNSIRLIEKKKGYLCVRCPFSGDYLEIYGTVDEVYWLNKQLRLLNLYRVD